MPEHMRERFVAAQVRDALNDTRIVMIQGARQVGKSTLAAAVAAERSNRIVTLDDEASRAFASDDPVGFVTQFPEGLLVVDEIQRAPHLAIALKASVDRDKQAGRFLITGSANLLDLTATQESLAGRVETISLESFSQGEIENRRGTFVDAVLNGLAQHGAHSDLTREDYLQIACDGGYPEALARSSFARRTRWYDAYLTQVLNRDASDISGLHRLADLPRIVRLIAARAGTGMVWNAVASEAGIPRRTLEPYVKLLETLYITHTLPAWTPNITGREVKQPKVFLRDTGLLAALLRLSPDGLRSPANRSMAGPLLESFVVGEVRRQLEWAHSRASLHHYRDSRGTEVDLVLEAPDGRIVGIEIKAAVTVQAKDIQGLAALRDRLGARFVAGYVLHTGQDTQQAGDRIFAAPLAILWRS